MSEIDPRLVGALQLQLDVLIADAQRRGRHDLVDLLKHASGALQEYHNRLTANNLYLQIPDDYEPPPAVGCGGSGAKKK